MKKFTLSLLGIILFLVFLSFFFNLHQVAGDSMEPAVKNRQTVVVWRYFLDGAHPRRGDIVFYKKDDQLYIGRVVGLPTESIRVQNGNLYLDNNVKQYQVEEEYLPKGTQTHAAVEGQWFKVGEFEYFVTSDKRGERVIDIEKSVIHRNNLVGKLLFAI